MDRVTPVMLGCCFHGLKILEPPPHRAKNLKKKKPSQYKVDNVWLQPGLFRIPPTGSSELDKCPSHAHEQLTLQLTPLTPLALLFIFSLPSVCLSVSLSLHRSGFSLSFGLVY